MVILKPHEKLQAFWRQPGYRETVARSEDDVACLEARYGVRLPEDFREYLLLASPRSIEWDDNDYTWWNLEGDPDGENQIQSLAAGYPHLIQNTEIAREATEYLLFVDYCIWASACAINCGIGPDRGRIALIGDGERIVADSFAEFVDLYLHDESRASIRQ